MKKAVKQTTFSKIFSTGSIILIILTIAAIAFDMSANRHISQTYEKRFLLVKNAEELKDTSGKLTNTVRNYAITANSKYYDEYFNEINKLKNRDIAVENLKNIGITNEEQQIIDEIFQISNDLVPIEEQAMNYVQSGRMQEAIALLYGEEYDSGAERVKSLNEEFNDKIAERMEEDISNKAMYVIITNITIFIIFGVLSIFQIINNIYFRKNVIGRIIKINDEMKNISKANFSSNFNLEPDTSEIGSLINSIIESKKFLKDIIADTTRACNELAAGNFDISPKVEYIGEFAEIKTSLQSFIIKITETLTNINMASDQVASGSEQLATGAQTLSSGAVGQADSVNRLALSINKINEQINKSAENARNVKNEASKVGEEVNISNDRMNELIKSIEEINESSLEVGKIIKTIEDIAFQTDILALNAAVEAARAGDAGKGFSVVAEEVRNLSVKSAQASKNTATLIENTISLIQKGNDAASNTVASLSEVFDLAKNMITMIDEIAETTEEEARAVNEVNNNVNDISEIVQQNSATAQQSAATSQELSAQAQTLKEEIHVFSLKTGGF